MTWLQNSLLVKIKQYIYKKSFWFRRKKGTVVKLINITFVVVYIWKTNKYENQNERLQDLLRNRYHPQGGKEKSKWYLKKGRLKEQVRNKYKAVSNKEKDVKREYGRNW